MSRSRIQASKFDRLRSQAKELLINRGQDAARPTDNMLEVIHELKIYQAELEIQNEELRQAQQEIATLHQEYADLYEFAPFAYLTLNAKGTITRINLSGVTLLGGTRTRILKSSFYTYLVPKYEDLYWSGREQAGKTGQKLCLEFQLKRDDRSLRWVRADIQADRTPTGEVLQWRLVLVDITQTKEAEAALQDSEDRFRVLYENAPIAYHAVDPTGKLVEANPAWLDLLGYEKDEVIGKSFAEFVHEDMRHMVAQYASFCEKTEKVRGFDFSMRKKNGDIIWVECRGKIDQSLQGKPQKIHWVVWDVTRQKRAEMEREQLEIELRHAQKIQSIGVLAGGIAHEFNNIMTIIIGNNELARDDHAKGLSVEEYLEEIHIASNRAKEIVRQLLAFGRKTGHATVPIDFRTILVESLNLIRSTLPANIEMQWDLSETDLFVVADPTQIQQVIINICNNATDAMPDDNGLITVRLKQLEMTAEETQKHNGLTPGAYAELKIGDNGLGIDSSSIDRIFDPFFSTKEVGMGSGMGLAVVHGIVKRHDGQIFVRSEPGKGTTFTLLLPLHQGLIENEKASHVPLPIGTERILFVDDEAATTKFSRKLLEKLGYRATAITSPQRALDMFQEAPDHFDLVITDMAMPGMTGDKLAAELLKIRPDLPIIMCTGHSETINKETAHAMGIRYFALKPLSRTRMAEMIRRVLDAEGPATVGINTLDVT